MRLWLREWLRVGPAVAIPGGLLWLLAEGDLDQGALLRSALWALVVWLACGLVWMGLQYGRWDDEPLPPRPTDRIGRAISRPTTARAIAVHRRSRVRVGAARDS